MVHLSPLLGGDAAVITRNLGTLYTRLWYILNYAYYYVQCFFTVARLSALFLRRTRVNKILLYVRVLRIIYAFWMTVSAPGVFYIGIYTIMGRRRRI